MKNKYELYTKEELISEIQTLKDSKKYGLVWEDYTEKADLITNPNFELSDEFSFGSETSDNPIKHEVFEGDNLLALKHLQKSHKGLIDVIYIDPPYNTGNKDFVYNDKFVDSEDGYRHSKWLSFMSKRLKLAKSLLSDEGVIFVSIDDNEQAQLKLLMDDIFGEQNSISPFIWEKTYSTKNNNKYTSSNHEYILVYVKNKLSLTSFTRLERTEKNNSQYKFDDNDGRGLYRKDNITAPNSKQKYVIEYKGRKYPPSKNGWRFTQDKMMQLIQDNRIYLPLDEGKRPSVKRYLSDVEGVVSKTILKYDEVGHTDMSKRELDAIISDVSNFDYPKPVGLLKYLVRLHPNKNATVLDFFAGSGTTGHAVMELNKEDGGNRNFILCTNNEVSEEKVRQHFINQGLLEKNTKTVFTKFRQENEELVNQFYGTEEYQKLGIARSVTYERLKRVIEGYTTPKGKFVEGLKGNRIDYFIASSKN